VTVSNTATQLISAGGFEGTFSPWVRSSTVIGYYTSGSTTAHSGGGNVYSSALSANANFYQSISIPSGASSVNLSFWLNVTSAETTTSYQYDKLTVQVYNSAGTSLLGTLATFSNLNKVSSSTAYTQRGNYSLNNWRGQTVRLRFLVTSNSSRATTFRIDDVSVLSQ
jgi:hypothetical protein